MNISKFEFIKSIINDTIKTGKPEIMCEQEKIFLRFKSVSKQIENIYMIEKNFFDKYLKNMFN